MLQVACKPIDDSLLLHHLLLHLLLRHLVPLGLPPRSLLHSLTDASRPSSKNAFEILPKLKSPRARARVGNSGAAGLTCGFSSAASSRFLRTYRRGVEERKEILYASECVNSARFVRACVRIPRRINAKKRKNELHQSRSETSSTQSRQPRACMSVFFSFLL